MNRNLIDGITQVFSIKSDTERTDMCSTGASLQPSLLAVIHDGLQRRVRRLPLVLAQVRLGELLLSAHFGRHFLQPSAMRISSLFF